MSAPRIRSGLIWWDTDFLVWTLQWLDAAGNEVRNTEYSAHKADLVRTARRDQPDVPLSIGTRASAPEPLTFEEGSQ